MEEEGEEVDQLEGEERGEEREVWVLVWIIDVFFLLFGKGSNKWIFFVYVRCWFFWYF